MNISKISKFLLKEKNKVIPVFLRLLGALLVFLLILSVNRFHAIELYGELAYYQIVVGFLATMILSGLDKIIIASFHNKNIDKTELISNHLIVIAVNFIIVSMVLWVIQFYLNMISIQILIIPIVGLKAVRLYLNEVSRANSQYNFIRFKHLF